MKVPDTGLDAKILHLLAAGETRSAPIADALSKSRRMLQDHLTGLRARGLVEARSRGTWTLTGAGQRAALDPTVPEPLGASEALAALPAEHRAVLRLIEDAVIARRALGEVHPSNWPGFILRGPTKSGKTLLATLAVRRFGLDPTDAIRLLMMETPGSLLERRMQDSGGAWRSEPSPLLALPIVVLDEYDKAGPELRTAAFPYLAGASRYRAEGMTLDVMPTVIVTLNDDGAVARLLPDAVLRRSVVLDTSVLREATADLHLTARRLARAAIPTLGAALGPPAAELPEHAWEALGTLLQVCLTERGWGLVDVEAMSRLVLGRWAQEPDLEAAVLRVGADYLLVTATREGLVEPDWPLRFEDLGGRSVGPIAATLAAARDRQAAGEARQVSEERASLADSLELAGTRARLVDALDHALSSAPRTELSPQERATIATVRGKGRLLRARLVEARILDPLGALEPVLEIEVLGPIRTVAAAREARRQQAELERERQHEGDREAHRRAVEARQVAQETRRAAQRDARSRRAAVKALCRRTTTRPGENVLGALLGADCLTRHDERHEVETIGSMVVNSPLGRAVRARLEPAKPPPSAPVDPWTLYPAGGFRPARADPRPDEPARRYKTETWTSYEDHGGHSYQASDLVAWDSDAVRAVLEAAAEALGLPRPSWSTRRARTPAVRAARASGRVRRG